jgi:hypothetical protein
MDFFNGTLCVYFTEDSEVAIPRDQGGSQFPVNFETMLDDIRFVILTTSPG